MGFSYQTIYLLCTLLQSLFTTGTDNTRKVAFIPGRPALYLSNIGWVTDNNQSYIETKPEILQFCRKIYGSDIWTISPSAAIKANIHTRCHNDGSPCDINSEYRLSPWTCIGAASESALSVREADAPGSGLMKLDAERADKTAAHEAAETPEEGLSKLFPSRSETQEKNRYVAAVKGLEQRYIMRHRVLEQELKDAEARLTDVKWADHPELTQNAEDDIHQEFIQKFMTLDNDKEVDRKHLQDVYREFTLKEIEIRSKAAVTHWDKALQTHKTNVTELTKAAQHLLDVIARNQYTKLRYYKQIMSQNAVTAGKWTKTWHQSILDLEKLLDENLKKLHKFPEIVKKIISDIRKYRHRNYAQLDKAIENFFANSYSPQIPIHLPSQRPTSLIKAKSIVEKYKHHNSKLSSRPQQNGSVDRAPFEQPHMLRVDQVETLTAIPNIPIDPHEKKNTEYNASTRTPSAAVKTAVQTDVEPKQAISPRLESVKAMVKSVMSDWQNKRPNVPTVNSYSSTARVITEVSMGVLLPVVLFVTGRWCLKRIRRYRERAGYTLTVDDVDGSLNRGVFGFFGRPGKTPGQDRSLSRDSNSKSNRLCQWQTNGYTNPAYKHTETCFPFDQQIV